MKARWTVLLTAVLLAVSVLGISGAASALTPAETLKQPPFPPTDVSLFEPAVYPAGPPLVPAGQTANDEATLRTQLRALLVKRFGSGNTQISQGLAKFDAASTKAIVPHPRLRAALVALKGTVGEPATNGALNGTYGKVRFGTPLNSSAIAQVFVPSGSTKLEIVFNDRYQYERIGLLASTMAHEVLHRDTKNSNKEELISHSIDSLVHGQFVLETPGLATSGTELARLHNTKLMARLNTRDANGGLRLFTSQGNVFPGGNFLPYFAASFEPLGNSNPGNAILKAEVRKVVGSSVTLPTTVNFDDDTALLLDSKQAVFTPAKLVQLATILKLDTSAQAAQRAQAAEATAPNRPTPSWEEIFGAE